MKFVALRTSRLALIAGGLVLAALSFGDAKIVSHMKADIMGKATERDITTYFKGDLMRTESGDTATIFNVATKSTLVLDLAKKTYYEVPEAARPDTAGMKVEATASVTPTEEKSKIAGYDCSKYLADVSISMAPQSGNFAAKTSMNLEFWTTTSLKTPYSSEHMLYMVSQMFRGAMAIQGMEKFSQEMAKVHGFPLTTKMTMSIEGLPGMAPPKIQIDQVVQSVSEDPLPDALFQAPSDFKKGEPRKAPRNGGGG